MEDMSGAINSILNDPQQMQKVMKRGIEKLS